MGKLQQIWEKYPDMRFEQLLINMGLIPDGAHWFVEDDSIEPIIDRVLERGFHAGP